MSFVLKKLLLGGAVCLIASGGVSAVEKAPLQKASAGKVERHYVYSPELRDTVTVDVWLPQGYNQEGTPYPVIYMHDGQNLFDATTSWNHQSWEMDSVTGALVDRGEIEAPVIVGVHSVAETRVADLMPEKALGYMQPVDKSVMSDLLRGNEVRGDRYAAFLVKTLKPEMDSIYNLTNEVAQTSLMGSSMGGLMSVYAMCEYPDVFGQAACLSTHWVGTLDGNPAFPEGMREYLRDRLPRDGKHRLYLDHGTVTIDSLYGVWEDQMINLAESAGYREGVTLETYVAEGAGHEERFWMVRVERPLRFLLGRRRK